MIEVTKGEPLPTLFQQYIAVSKYSRWLEEEGRREIWPEPARRYVENVIRPVCDKAGVSTDETNALCERAFKDIAAAETLPSMRALMTAGPALDRDHAASYNCSFVAIDCPKAFDETLYLLACGCGVGFSVERQFICKLPEVPEEMHDTDTTIVVRDSKIGWATALRQLISLLYAGQIPKIDVSKVRGSGERLKTFGGRASGPEPFVDLCKYVIRTFKGSAGRKLNSVEAHGIVCKTGEAIVVGGVRRSATLSLSNLTDQRMRNAKSGQWWIEHPEYSLANNSVAYTEKPDIGIFLEEWHALYQSKSGERGIFNRQGVQKKAKKLGKRDAEQIVGTNPCVTYETPLLTRHGYVPIGLVADKQVDIWNGREWSQVRPYSTGVNEIVRVNFTDGSHIDCTPYHKFLIVEKFNNEKVERVQAEDLEPGMKLQKWDMPVVGAYNYVDDMGAHYSQGFYSGDGNRDYNYSYLYEPKYCCESRLVGRIVPDTEGRKRWIHGPMLDKGYVPVNGQLQDRLNWLAGILDSDGTVTRDKNGNGLQITSIDHEFLRNIRLMLSTMGVRAKVVSGNEAGMRMMPDGRGGHKEYECQQTKRLLIGNSDTCALLRLGLKCSRLQIHGTPPQRDARQYVRVKSVEWLGTEEETFCVTEPNLNQMTLNGIVTGNCGEISLRSAGFCNLTEIVVRPNDTLETLLEKAELASILGTIQSTLTEFRYLRPIWKRNAEEERLLGVSMTGIYDHPQMTSRGSELEWWLYQMKEKVIATNKEWAAKLGINSSVACSTLKPAGTTSSLSNTASGIHPRHSEYYIRSVRQDNKDALTAFLKDQGVPWEPCVQRPDSTTVFFFPLASPDGALTRDDVKALDHLKLWATYNEHWSEHQVSITVNVQESEWLDVAAWVYREFDSITGISFLPFDGGSYRQAPFEACTYEQYQAALAKMPTTLDWTKLTAYEQADTTTGMRELACVGGVCSID